MAGSVKIIRLYILEKTTKAEIYYARISTNL